MNFRPRHVRSSLLLIAVASRASACRWFESKQESTPTVETKIESRPLSFFDCAEQGGICDASSRCIRDEVDPEHSDDPGHTVFRELDLGSCAFSDPGPSGPAPAPPTPDCPHD